MGVFLLGTILPSKKVLLGKYLRSIATVEVLLNLTPLPGTYFPLRRQFGGVNSLAHLNHDLISTFGSRMP
jgi:hypothetical protein